VQEATIRKKRSAFLSTLLGDTPGAMGGPRYAEAAFWTLCLCFFVVAGLQSFTLHYEFLSNNADLGFHNHLAYKFSHFKAPSTTLWNVPDSTGNHYLKNCFGDHVTGLMPLNSQLYWIFGSYALLVAQILYMIVGARGLYQLIAFKCKHTGLALFGVLLFFMHYSLYAALDFDAHDNVYGMMFLPWILYHYYKRNLRGFMLCLVIFLIARDDLALTGISMGLSLLIFDWKRERIYGLCCLGISLGYFVLAFYFIIPHLSSLPSGGYNAWRFAALGSNIPEVIQTIVTRPGYTLSLFYNDPAKVEKFTYFLYTGGILVFFWPRFILFFIPTFLVTCLSGDWSLWGNLNHYNIIFGVLLPFLVMITVARFRHVFFRLALLVLAMHYYSTYLTINFNRDWTHFGRIFSGEFYHRRETLPEIREMLKLIPPDAVVSGSSHLTPHLAARDTVLWYPDISHAEYIALLDDKPELEFYPFHSLDDFNRSIEDLKADPDWELIYNKKNILLFRRKKR
jgi:uncharacterized membrane protein